MQNLNHQQNITSFIILLFNSVKKRYRSKNKYPSGLRRDAKKLCLPPTRLQNLFPDHDRRNLINALEEDPEQNQDQESNQEPSAPTISINEHDQISTNQQHEPISATKQIISHTNHQQPISNHQQSSATISINNQQQIDSKPAVTPGPLKLHDSGEASLWWPGKARKRWIRPCSRGYRSILIADSQLQCFRHEGITLPGFLLVSFSGMDIMTGSI